MNLGNVAPHNFILKYVSPLYNAIVLMVLLRLVLLFQPVWVCFLALKGYHGIGGGKEGKKIRDKSPGPNRKSVETLSEICVFL